MAVAVVLVLLAAVLPSNGLNLRAPCPPGHVMSRAGTGRPRRMVVTSAMEDMATLEVPEGGSVTKTLVQAGAGGKLMDGAVAVVRYTGTFRRPEASRDQVFGQSAAMTVTVGDGTMVPGWDAALRSMRVGEQAQFVVDAAAAYGREGVPPAIPSNMPLAFDVEVLDLKGNIITDATFADSAPLTPRSPASIKAEFERKQAEKAPAREGLDGFQDWVKSIYIFGFFTDTPGAVLPWYLRPLITFPVMFAVVGVAYFLVINGGAVTTQRELIDPETDLFSLAWAAKDLYLS